MGCGIEIRAIPLLTMGSTGGLEGKGRRVGSVICVDDGGWEGTCTIEACGIWIKVSLVVSLAIGSLAPAEKVVLKEVGKVILQLLAGAAMTGCGSPVVMGC